MRTKSITRAAISALKVFVIATCSLVVLAVTMSFYRVWAYPLFNCSAPLATKVVPMGVVAGVLGQEDHHFFRHNGVEWNFLLQAIVRNFREKKILSGASTITMQVSTLCFRDQEKQGEDFPSKIWRKGAEIFDALILERVYSKSQILEVYLSKVPLVSGRDAPRGFLAASEFYFAMPLLDLNEEFQWKLITTLRNADTLNPAVLKTFDALSPISRRILQISRRQKEEVLVKERELLEQLPYVIGDREVHKNYIP